MPKKKRKITKKKAPTVQTAKMGLLDKQILARELLKQEISMFHGIMEGMRKGLTYEELLRLIVASVTKGLGYDRAGLFLLAPGGKVLERAVGIDDNGKFEYGADVRSRHPVSGRKGFSIFSDLINGYKDHFLTQNILKQMPGAAGNVVSGVTCNVNVPLKIGKNRIIGILAVDNLFSHRQLTEDDVTSLKNFATQAGLVIESVRLQEELKTLTVTDETTSLYNRRFFDGHIAQEVLRCQRYRHSCGLIVADVDDFKRFNEKWGDKAGDDVLRHVADVLRAGVRGVDTVARIGDDEFAVILPEAAQGDVIGVAGRLVKAVEESEPEIEGIDNAERVTLSVGVACFPLSASHPDRLVELAYEGVSKAKMAGKNRVGELAEGD